MLESSRVDGGSEIVESEYRPYANSGYRGVYALFIGVDRGRLDFESLDMNAPTRAATSSGFSSSAKWPAVDQVNVSVGNLAFVSLRFRRLKRLIVSSPHHERRRLRLPEPGLPRGITCYVGR